MSTQSIEFEMDLPEIGKVTITATASFAGLDDRGETSDIVVHTVEEDLSLDEMDVSSIMMIRDYLAGELSAARSMAADEIREQDAAQRDHNDYRNSVEG